jgi:hypothetical protein
VVSGQLGLLPAEDRFFTLRPVAVVAENPAAQDDPVAGNDVGYGVGPNRSAYGSAGRGIFDGCCQPLVAGHCPGGNAQQSLPHLDLKIRAFEQQGNRDVILFPGGCKDPSAHGRGSLPILEEPSPGPAAAQIPEGAFRVRGIDEGQTAQPSIREGEQTLPEGAAVQAVGDLQPRAQSFVLTRGHRINGDEQVVEAARAGQTGLVGRIQLGAAFEQLFRMLDREVLQEAFRTDTGPAGEQALEVVGAEVDLLGYFLEAGLIVNMVFEIQDRLFDPPIVVIHVRVFHEPIVGLCRGERNPNLAVLSPLHALDSTRISPMSSYFRFPVPPTRGIL